MFALGIMFGSVNRTTTVWNTLDVMLTMCLLHTTQIWWAIDEIVFLSFVLEKYSHPAGEQDQAAYQQVSRDRQHLRKAEQRPSRVGREVRVTDDCEHK
jgi:exonuclease I